MKIVLRGLIRLYQLTLSPLFGPTCRYLPTCSHYAAEAIERHGAWRGGWLTVARLSRCHPWGSDGFDPVPEQLNIRYGLLNSWRYGQWSRPPHEKVK